MNSRVFLTAAALVAVTPLMHAQVQERRAVIRGGGSNGQGKCTIEVVVDGAADVEVRSDRAVVRNLSGNPAQLRRFECNAVMPPNPGDFRFEGVDGRGRQQLIRDPRNGGAAVVRIEDPQGGSEAYTFDLIWSGAGNQGGYGGGYNGPADRGYNGPADRGYNGPPDRANNGGYNDRGTGYPDNDAYHRDREDAWKGNNGRQRLFEHVRADVEHLRSTAFSQGDQYRLARTLQQLDELQNKLAAGRYDERELDEVTMSLQRVAQDNRLARQDRQLLMDDLERLRDFRGRHGEYGAR